MTISSEKRLIEELERARRLDGTRQRSPELAAALDRLARWQACRLNATYADLARDPRYAQAIAFFGSDLYGPGDFSGRDADLARVVPIMVRMLPEAVVATMATAMELSALSRELDRTLLRELGDDTLSVPTYCAAYRACANRPARKRQIALIIDVGRALDHYVHRAFLRQTLRLMRRPAKVARLSALQDFLERGFTSFAGMHGADQFLVTIEARETALMEAIFAGDRAPFPDPLA
jgi:hypothetical protein